MVFISEAATRHSPLGILLDGQRWEKMQMVSLGVYRLPHPDFKTCYNGVKIEAGFPLGMWMRGM